MHLFNIVVIWKLSVKGIVMEWFGRWIIIDEFFFIKFANLMFKLALHKTDYDVKQLTWGLYIQSTIFVNCKYVYDFDHFIFYRVVYIFMWFIIRSCHVCFYLLWMWKCTLKFHLFGESSQLPWNLSLQLLILFFLDFKLSIFGVPLCQF
jgi:hypothetical protein